MIAAVILAAGAARRLGRPKQLLEVDGRPLVRHVAEAACAAGLDQIIVVTGANAPLVAAAVSGLPVDIVENISWADGQAGSLKTGLAACRAGTQAAVFLLADQPLVTPALIAALADTFRQGASVVVPRAGDRRGNPVLFGLDRWQSELIGLSGDEGARRLLAVNPDEIGFVPVADEATFFDVDTQADYEKLLDLWAKRARK